jgi:hypothetical protein
MAISEIKEVVPPAMKHHVSHEHDEDAVTIQPQMTHPPHLGGAH